MKRNNLMSDELKKYAELIPFFAETLGNAFEIDLFDLADPDYPIVASANSNIDVQEKERAFVAEAAGSQKARNRKYIANRPIQFSFSKMLKTSVFFIKDSSNEITGALCISMQCDFFMKMSGFAANLLQFNTNDLDDDSFYDEDIPASSKEPSLDSITEMVKEYGVEPERITQGERLEIICDLYDMGVYNLKGAVAKTAEALQVSEQSVYRYITKIKKARDW